MSKEKELSILSDFMLRGIYKEQDPVGESQGTSRVIQQKEYVHVDITEYINHLIHRASPSKDAESGEDMQGLVF